MNGDKSMISFKCVYHPYIKLTSGQECSECNKLLKQEDKQVFKSGATSSESLPMYDCIPLIFLERTAERFTLGANKHGKFNYRKGLNDKEFILDRLNHALVHLVKATQIIQEGGQFTDDNLGAVAVNIAMAMEYELVNNIDSVHALKYGIIGNGEK